MIEIYQLRYFLAVVESGSFTKAAERVYVTQPTLSAGIKKLETGLETMLFDRSGKRVFLTESGTRFVERAKSILHQVNLAEAEVRAVDSPKLLRLGVLMTISSDVVRKMLQPFYREVSGLVIELYEGTEQEIQNRLDDGRIDVALTIVRGAPCEQIIPLYREGYSLAISAHHPLAGQASIHPKELANEPTIVRSRCEILSETSRFFTDHNVRPRLVFRSPQDERALSMVGAGVGYTTMPDHYHLDGVKRIPMEGYDFSRELGLIRTDHHVGTEKKELLEHFSTFTKSHLPNLRSAL